MSSAGGAKPARLDSGNRDEGREKGIDAKIAGRAVHVGQLGDGPAGDLFHADITEVVLTHLDDAATKLIIESWAPGRGLRQIERE
jgi:hypothetical protein